MVSNNIRKIVFFSYAIVLIATVCQAQTGTGNIQGTVKDQTGAVVPKAKVTLIRTDTGRQYEGETNGVGFFLFPTLELGPYQLRVESAGMETWRAEFSLLAGQTADISSVLRPGAASTIVDVKDNA